MNSKKGFTLIELLIALAIFTVVATLAGSLFVSGFKNYEKVSGIMAGQMSVRQAMYEISKELRNAKLSDITINELGTSVTIGDVVYSYSSSSAAVSRTISGATTVIASNITSFSVELAGETVNYSIRSSDESAELKSSVTLKEFVRPSPT